MRQTGFTLVEVLVAMAVGTIILTGVVLSIYQVVWSTDRSNSQVTVLTDLNTAALAIKEDLMMTQTTNLSSTPQSSANLSWIDYTSFGASNQTSHSSRYILSGTNLTRNYDGTVTIVGRRITSISFTQSGKVVTVVITAAGYGTTQRRETLKFSSHIRAEELE